MSFLTMLWSQLRQLPLLRRMPPTSIVHACPMHMDQTSRPRLAQLGVRHCRLGRRPPRAPRRVGRPRLARLRRPPRTQHPPCLRHRRSLWTRPQACLPRRVRCQTSALMRRRLLRHLHLSYCALIRAVRAASFVLLSALMAPSHGLRPVLLMLRPTLRLNRDTFRQRLAFHTGALLWSRRFSLFRRMILGTWSHLHLVSTSLTPNGCSR